MTRVAICMGCAAALMVAGCGDDKNPIDVHMSTDAGNDGGGADNQSTTAGDPSPSEAVAVERGRYLVEDVIGCVDCHTPRTQEGELDMDRYLAGVDCFADADPSDPDFGCLPSRNLTNHETGLMNRSDDEIKDMLTKGERPDGSALHPIMPYYVLGNMSDPDVEAIVAYLRTVEGVDHMVPDAQPPFTVDMPAPRWPQAAIPMPADDYPEKEAALRGRYLAGNIGVCMQCHTARDDRGRPMVDKAFQGGEVFERDSLGLPPVFPEQIVSPNITPHATGIEKLSIDDIVATLKEGIDPTDDLPLCPPMPGGAMPGYGNLIDRDAEDIAHYLLSIPGGENEIDSDCAPPSGSDDADGGA